MTAQELRDALAPAIDRNINVLYRVNQWLERGDGVAIYVNTDFGHPDQGHHQYVSFGGPEALIQGRPPTMMPDIGSAINWRYVLLDTYEGAAL